MYPGLFFGAVLVILGLYELFNGFNPSQKAFGDIVSPEELAAFDPLISPWLFDSVIITIGLGIIVTLVMSYIRYKKIFFDGKNVEITDSELEGINNYKTPSTKEFELKDLVKTEEGTTTYPGATIVIETRAAKAKVSSVTIRSKKTPDITFIADGEERTSSYEYGIEDDETELSFDVVARGAYEPTVKIINGRNEKELTADSSAPNGNNKTIYTYHVLTGALTSGDSIVIDGEEVNKNLTIEYNKADIAKVEVYVNGYRRCRGT